MSKNRRTKANRSPELLQGLRYGPESVEMERVFLRAARGFAPERVDPSLPVVDVSTFRVDRLSMKLGWSFRGDLEMRVALETPAAPDGHVYFQTTIDGRFLTEVRDDSFVRQEIRRRLIDAIVHEIDECLFIDGRRVRTPHTLTELLGTPTRHGRVRSFDKDAGTFTTEESYVGQLSELPEARMLLAYERSVEEPA